MIATYTYNALDQRIGIQESGGQTWTVYNGANADALPYADFNGSGTLLTRYVSGPGMVNGAAVDELLARTSSGGTTAWYLTDKLDSVRDIVSSSGTELDHVVYDSFGNILTETNASNGDRFKFAGMEFDATISQYLDGARWYNPAGGKFVRIDPAGLSSGDENLFRYVSNCPLTYYDPTGELQAPGTGSQNPNPVQGQGTTSPGEMVTPFQSASQVFGNLDEPVGKPGFFPTGNYSPGRMITPPVGQATTLPLPSSYVPPYMSLPYYNPAKQYFDPAFLVWPYTPLPFFPIGAPVFQKPRMTPGFNFLTYNPSDYVPSRPSAPVSGSYAFPLLNTDYDWQRHLDLSDGELKVKASASFPLGKKGSRLEGRFGVKPFERYFSPFFEVDLDF